MRPFGRGLDSTVLQLKRPQARRTGPFGVWSWRLETGDWTLESWSGAIIMHDKPRPGLCRPDWTGLQAERTLVRLGSMNRPHR
eukprot:6079746-Prymnesium_polylepis.2